MRLIKQRFERSDSQKGHIDFFLCYYKNLDRYRIVLDDECGNSSNVILNSDEFNSIAILFPRILDKTHFDQLDKDEDLCDDGHKTHNHI